MLSIFRAAAAGANLSPAARAFLRFVDGLAVAAIVAALPVVAQLLAGQLDTGAVNWAQVGTIAVCGVAFAFLMALAKWARAHGDAPLADVVTQVADAVAGAGGLSNDVKQELSAAGLPNTPDPGPLGVPGAVADAAK